MVVTKDDGLVFKRVYNRIKQDNKLLLVSTNSVYEPYEIDITEVLEIWKFALRFTEEMVNELVG